MSSQNSTTWPPAQGLTTPRVPRQDTILPTFASCQISAPASMVWAVLLDTSTYHMWNSFCPRVTIHSQPQDASSQSDPILRKDTSFTFHVVMDNAKPEKVTDTQLRVTDISTPDQRSTYISEDILESEPSFSSDLFQIYRIAWTTEGGFVARGLRSERFHEVIPLGEVTCEVRTWENQGGVLARAVKYYYKNILKMKFAEWCEDLKREAEKRVKDGGRAETSSDT